MRASDGAMQTFPRTGHGAMDAVKFLEDLCMEDNDSWQANRELAVEMANSPAGNIQNAAGETIKSRLAELMELVEGEQTILDAG
jgi:hypothetical protein